jgi:eukaryotic-like serine/threonine-protein kinase
MQTPRPEAAPQDLLAGRYRVGVPIAAGGMGTVFDARDRLLQRRVAIKCLPPELDANLAARERLRREALAGAALDHSFICKIFELGEDHDAVFLVMECVVCETTAPVNSEEIARHPRRRPEADSGSVMH